MLRILGYRRQCPGVWHLHAPILTRWRRGLCTGLLFGGAWLRGPVVWHLAKFRHFGRWMVAAEASSAQAHFSLKFTFHTFRDRDCVEKRNAVTFWHGWIFGLGFAPVGTEAEDGGRHGGQK